MSYARGLFRSSSRLCALHHFFGDQDRIHSLAPVVLFDPVRSRLRADSKHCVCSQSSFGMIGGRKFSWRNCFSGAVTRKVLLILLRSLLHEPRCSDKGACVTLILQNTGDHCCIPQIFFQHAILHPGNSF